MYNTHINLRVVTGSNPRPHPLKSIVVIVVVVVVSAAAVTYVYYPPHHHLTTTSPSPHHTSPSPSPHHHHHLAAIKAIFNATWRNTRSRPTRKLSVWFVVAECSGLVYGNNILLHPKVLINNIAAYYLLLSPLI